MKNLFLRSLSDADFSLLGNSLGPVEIARGQDIYRSNAHAEWVYFPLSGLVSLMLVMPSGEEADTAVVGCEGGVGLIEALGFEIVSYRAMVQVDLKALRISAAAYRAALDASPSLRRTVYRHIELATAEARQSIACQAHHSVEQRLAWWLLECQARSGQDRLPLTQEFLGAMLGVQRTSVTKFASALKKAGLIQYSRGVIDILDRAGLERRSCECHATNQHRRDLFSQRSVEICLASDGADSARQSWGR